MKGTATLHTEDFQINAFPDDKETEVQIVVRHFNPDTVIVKGIAFSIPQITVNLSPGQARLLINEIEQSLGQLT